MSLALLDRPSEARRPVPHADPAARRRHAPRLSCVVPCFNEADNLQQLLPLLARFLAQRFASWEIVLVDDGSDDHSAAVIEQWTVQPHVEAVQLSRNFGKEAALAAGLDVANGDVVVLLDADLQHPLGMIDAMVERWRAGADVVYAARSDRRDEPFLKRLGTGLFYRLINAGDRYTVPPDAGDFRLMDRAVVDALLALPERNRFMKGLYAWVGFHAEALPYRPEPRAQGRSKFDTLALIGLSVDGLTGFTTWPLRMVGVAGLALAALSFLYGAWLVASYCLWGNDVSGWTTIIVSLLLFAGIQLISLGIVGEYLARVFDEVKARPLYVVKRRLGDRLEKGQSP